jgi:hypothetical protein
MNILMLAMGSAGVLKSNKRFYTSEALKDVTQRSGRKNRTDLFNKTLLDNSTVYHNMQN